MKKEDMCCSNCEYYSIIDETGGTCGYNPPSVFWLNKENLSISIFPEVYKNSWCGKFEPSEAFK